MLSCILVYTSQVYIYISKRSVSTMLEHALYHIPPPPNSFPQTTIRKAGKVPGAPILGRQTTPLADWFSRAHGVHVIMYKGKSFPTSPRTNPNPTVSAIHFFQQTPAGFFPQTLLSNDPCCRCDAFPEIALIKAERHFAPSTCLLLPASESHSPILVSVPALHSGQRWYILEDRTIGEKKAAGADRTPIIHNVTVD